MKEIRCRKHQNYMIQNLYNSTEVDNKNNIYECMTNKLLIQVIQESQHDGCANSSSEAKPWPNGTICILGDSMISNFVLMQFSVEGWYLLIVLSHD